MASQLTPAWAASGFAPGTFIQTTRGLRPVERLVPGEDMMENRDGSALPLLALHKANFTKDELKELKEARPIQIAALALGGTVPTRPLLVAPNAHVMAQGRLVNRVTEAREVLIPAGALTGYDGVDRIIPEDGVTYFHPICAEHGLVRVEGLMSETLYLGDGADSALREASPAAARDMKSALPRADSDTANRLSRKMNKKNRPISADSDGD
ncbi:MAG: Hint domain-containing protein [Pseudomonadota bacterium]